jgi:hypothetical protein
MVHRGLPVRLDGRLDRAAAIAWYKNNVVPPAHPSPARAEAPAAAESKPATVGAAAMDWVGRQGYRVGAAITGWTIYSHSVEWFAQMCCGGAFRTLMDREPLAYRVFPIAAALTLAAKLREIEPSYCLRLRPEEPIPELAFDELFAVEAEGARRLFGECAEICRRQPLTDGLRRGLPEGQQTAFQAGHREAAALVIYQLSTSIAVHFPRFVCGPYLAEEGEDYEEVKLSHQLYPVAVLSVLMRGWCEDLFAEARRLGLSEPAGVPFGELFGAKARAAKEAFDELSKGILDGEAPDAETKHPASQARAKEGSSSDVRA